MVQLCSDSLHVYIQVVSDVSGGCGQAYDVIIVSPAFEGCVEEDFLQRKSASSGSSAHVIDLPFQHEHSEAASNG